MVFPRARLVLMDSGYWKYCKLFSTFVLLACPALPQLVTYLIVWSFMQNWPQPTILPAKVDKTTLSAEYLDPHMPTVCSLPRDSSWRPWQLVSPPAALTGAGCDGVWSVISFYKLLPVLLRVVNDITSWSVSKKSWCWLIYLQVFKPIGVSTVKNRKASN